MGIEQPDFYLYSTGPFAVRVYEQFGRVEAAAHVYLANNKYFGVEDFAAVLNVSTPERYRFAHAGLSKGPHLESVNLQWQNAKPERAVPRERKIAVAAAQIAFFDVLRYKDTGYYQRLVRRVLDESLL